MQKQSKNRHGVQYPLNYFNSKVHACEKVTLLNTVLLLTQKWYHCEHTRIYYDFMLWLVLSQSYISATKIITGWERQSQYYNMKPLVSGIARLVQKGGMGKRKCRHIDRDLSIWVKSADQVMRHFIWGYGGFATVDGLKHPHHTGLTPEP